MYTNELLTGAKNELIWAGISEQEQAKRLAVVKEALEWINTPYHHMGRKKGVGVDCGMLLAEIFETCGQAPHLEFDYYPPDWSMHRSEEHYLKHINGYLTEVTHTPLPGDVLVYRFGRCVSHGAIVIFQNIILHSYINLGVVIADRFSPELHKREYACYSLWDKK